MPKRATDSDTMNWPKEQSRRAGELRHCLAWTEASRWHPLGEELPDVAIADAARYRVELEALAGQEAKWRRTSKEQFQMLAFQQVMAFGSDEDPARISRFMSLYPVIAERLTVLERLRMVEQVTTYVARYGLPFGRIFNPFLHLEQDETVFASSLMAFVSYFNETSEENRLTGPEAALSQMPLLSPRKQGLTVSVLLLLGDRRLLPLLDGIWNELDPQGATALTQNRSGFMYAAMAEFYLNWMEAVDESEYGIPAAGLIAMRQSAMTPIVIDVERDIPVADPEVNPVRMIHQWTIEEFAREIEPRLRNLLAREGEEKVIPFVLEAWGLEWVPATSAEAATLERQRRLIREQHLAMGGSRQTNA